MHILIAIIIGLIVLAVFVGAATLINKERAADGARIFIGVWLIASIVNGAFGVLQANIPVINEIGAFIPIFGVPAAAAWYVSRRLRMRRADVGGAGS